MSRGGVNVTKCKFIHVVDLTESSFFGLLRLSFNREVSGSIPGGSKDLHLVPVCFRDVYTSIRDSMWYKQFETSF